MYYSTYMRARNYITNGRRIKPMQNLNRHHRQMWLSPRTYNTAEEGNTHNAVGLRCSRKRNFSRIWIVSTHCLVLQRFHKSLILKIHRTSYQLKKPLQSRARTDRVQYRRLYVSYMCPGFLITSAARLGAFHICCLGFNGGFHCVLEYLQSGILE